jgi:hypothetical protein
MTSWCCITYCYKIIMWNKTIQSAKQIASIHNDWKIDGNKEKLGYEKRKKLWLQTYKLILGIGDGLCALDMCCDLSCTFLSRSMKLSWFLNLQVVLDPIPFKTWPMSKMVVLDVVASFLELEFPLYHIVLKLHLATQLILKKFALAFCIFISSSL